MSRGGTTEPPKCAACGRGPTREVQTLRGTFLLCATCDDFGALPPPRETRVVKMGNGMPFDVDISRTGKWGNPFVIGRDGCRATVIAKYREWISRQPKLLADLHELRGKVLGCFCAPLSCHGDVLVELAEKAAAPRFKLPPLPKRQPPPKSMQARTTAPRSRSKNVVECLVDHTYAENESGNEQECVVVECSECEHTERSWGHSDRSVRRCLVLMGQNCPEGADNFYVIGEET